MDIQMSIGGPMTRNYSIAEARDRLPALVHAVETGPSVQLTRRGRPVAVLVSVDEYQRLCPRRPDLWQAIQAFRQHTDLRDLDAEGIFRDVRDESPGREVAV